MVSGQCLCGAHRFELEGPFELNHHCHCGFCRKHHGSAFVSLVGVAAERLRWTRGDVIAYASSAGVVRESCATCGSGLPQQIEGLPIFVPAGCLDGLDTTFDFHIFAGSKAPWYEISDGLPTFDAYPPGVDSPIQETRPPQVEADGVRGSCLCGDVHYVIDGPASAARHCHCGRCRRGRAAAHASNLVVASGALRFTGGEDRFRRYKVPEARYFTQCFCARCGGKVPTVDLDRGIAIVPLGGLDDPPPIEPAEHIWTADVPAWSGIHDALPQRPGPPS
jgi:hypothetical protein